MPVLRRLLTILLLLLPVTAMAKPVVTEARVGQDADITRIELRMPGSSASNPLKYHAFYLADPYRLVIDMDEVAWQVPGGHKLQGGGLVTTMRYGLFKPGTSRVVLDLSQPARIGQARVEGTDGGSVLAIELTAWNDADFRLAVQGKAPAGPVQTADTTSQPSQNQASQGQPSQNEASQNQADQAKAGQLKSEQTKTDKVAKSNQATNKTKGVKPADPEDVLSPIGDQPAASDPVGKGDGATTKSASNTKKSKIKPMIVIDPGHGGVDPGALGTDGTMEKNITLAVAQALKKELQSSGHYRVMLTRDKDIYIPLRDRFKIARDNGADLFISLHADSHNNPLLRGASVYTLSDNASDAEAAALATQENKSDIIAGVDLSKQNGMVTDILIDLAQRDTINLSSRFAGQLVTELKSDTLMLEHSHRSAGFAVLKAPDVPSVLIEMGYISSSKDQALLLNKQHQAKLAKAIRRAVDDFFDWHELVNNKRP